MRLDSKAIYVYALLLFLGGLMGFFMAGSIKSIVAGSLGAAALFSIEKQLQASSSKPRKILTFLIPASFFLVFLFRYFATKAFMPSGLMALISLGMSLYLFVNRIYPLFFDSQRS